MLQMSVSLPSPACKKMSSSMKDLNRTLKCCFCLSTHVPHSDLLALQYHFACIYKHFQQQNVLSQNCNSWRDMGQAIQICLHHAGSCSGGQEISATTMRG